MNIHMTTSEIKTIRAVKKFKYMGHVWAVHKAFGGGRIFTVSHYETGARVPECAEKSVNDAIKSARKTIWKYKSQLRPVLGNLKKIN